MFDVARQVHLVESDGGRILSESDLTLPQEIPAARAARLAELGVDTLVCGAISRPLHMMVESQGVRVFAFMAGELGPVMSAWLEGVLEQGRFSMPGCCGQRRRRFMQNSSAGREEAPAAGRSQGGMNPRGNRGGLNRRGSGSGQGDSGLTAGGGAGFCVCPECGHREPHRRGVPCIQRQCPQCGTALTRE